MGLDDEETCRRLADDPNTSAIVLEYLSTHKDDWVRRCMADNPSASEYALDVLSRDDDVVVRITACHNPNISYDTAVRVAREEPQEPVRSALAQNDNVPVGVLEILLTDRIPRVYSIAARNPQLDAARLLELAGSKFKYMRVGVAKNLNSNLKVLAKLANDDFSPVSTVVHARLQSMDDDKFNKALVACGAGELVGLPRTWVLKALA